VTTRWDVERALRESGLPAAARHVALELLTRTDGGGTEVPAKFTPSLTALAADTGLSRRRVIYSLDVLESSGWLTRLRDLEAARKKKQPTRYRLKVPASARGALVHDVHQPASAPGAPASAGSALELVHQAHEVSAAVAHNQTFQTNTRPSSSRRTPRTGSRGRAAATDDDDSKIDKPDPRTILAGLGVDDPEAGAIIARLEASGVADPAAYLLGIAASDDGEVRGFLDWIRR
jgi:hypothetical protein